MPGRLILIRHCESSGNAPDAALTEQGALAAAALADRLAAMGPDAVYSSPYARARATVEPFATRMGIAILDDDRLKEWVLAARPPADLLGHMRQAFEDADYRLPDGESLHDAQARALASLAEIAGRAHQLPVVASHGRLIASVLRSIDPEFGLESWRAMSNPDLFELTFDGASLTAYGRLD